ncbi:hypothetical protein PR048_033110 [Dryococelus australis]|uniref:Uncharacterized protein n=1 Tax=Dryococelus australis TaxID=614101 RepID=A0ABQ9FZC0_9NEOP|nr:hypothetical protein PR048_033110 [Dryococelus australis]
MVTHPRAATTIYREVPSSRREKAYYRLPFRRLQRRGVRAVSLLASHHGGELGSIIGQATPGFLHLGIVPDDAACCQVFLGISSLTHPFIPARVLTFFASPPSALRTSRLGATQISQLSHSVTLHIGEILGRGFCQTPNISTVCRPPDPFQLQNGKVSGLLQNEKANGLLQNGKANGLLQIALPLLTFFFRFPSKKSFILQIVLSLVKTRRTRRLIPGAPAAYAIPQSLAVALLAYAPACRGKRLSLSLSLFLTHWQPPRHLSSERFAETSQARRS